GPHRHGVIRLLRAHTEVRRALAHRKCVLTLGAEQARNAAISSTTNQMCVEAALAVMRALRVRTVAGGALHDSLLMRIVGRTSGVYSECPRLSLVHIHPRYRGTLPVFISPSLLLRICAADHTAGIISS